MAKPVKRSQKSGGTRQGDRDYWLTLVPIFVFSIVAFYSHAHAPERIDSDFFDAASQIVPLLVIALAIDVRYFSPRRYEGESPTSARVNQWGVRIYGLLTLVSLLLAEGVALSVVATGQGTDGDFALVVAGLSTGAVALILSLSAQSFDGDPS